MQHKHALSEYRRWTEAEDKEVLAATGNMRRVAARLGRTTGAVNKRRSVLLFAQSHGVTPQEAARRYSSKRATVHVIVTREEADQLRHLAALRRVTVAALVREKLRTPAGDDDGKHPWSWHLTPPAPETPPGW